MCLKDKINEKREIIKHNSKASKVLFSLLSQGFKAIYLK